MITGSIVALITPMTADGSIDWDNLERLLEFHIEQGTNGIVAVGTTGESATLDHIEHLKVIEFIIQKVNGRIPVIAGTGSNSTKEAIYLTSQAEDLGADAALLVSPYYNKPTQEGIYLHHKAVAANSKLPQILYNVPGRTGSSIEVDTIKRLAELESIVGIKEATGDLELGQKVIDSVGEKIAVYSGDDATAYELILKGGKGNISVTANILPAKMAELCKLALEGKSDDAKSLNDGLMAVHNAMFIESNPIPVKYALEQMGYTGSGLRLPLTRLDEKHQQMVNDAMAKFNLI